MLDALRSQPDAGIPVLHWFTGTVRQAEAAVELGCWFSVGTSMLTSAKGRELVAMLPRDRVLTETDGPFVTYDDRPVQPRDVAVTQQMLAACWDIGTLQAQDQVAENLRTILAFEGVGPVGR